MVVKDIIKQEISKVDSELQISYKVMLLLTVFSYYYLITSNVLAKVAVFCSLVINQFINFIE